MSGNVLTNDSDLDDGDGTLDPLTVTDVDGTAVAASGDTTITGSEGGELVIAADGSFTYTPGERTPASRPEGIDSYAESFEYTVSDGALTDTATLTLQVNGDNVTPDVIFGSGNSNGGFTTSTQADSDGNLVELGLRAKLRFDENNAPQNEFNANGDGTYTFDNDVAPGGFSDLLTTPIWSFEWSVNTDADAAAGSEDSFLDGLTYLLEIDGDAGAGTNFELSFDPINPAPPTIPFFDNAIGDNGTGNGAGSTAGDAASYATLIGTNNVAQNSSNYEFLNEFGTIIDQFDPTDEGTYTIRLTAFDGGTEVTSVEIDINIVAENDQPFFTSGNTFDADENQLLVGTIEADDFDVDDNLTYSITGGADGARFRIDSVTGELTFDAAPNFEAPGSADGDNAFEVQVTVDDNSTVPGAPNTAVQTITVNVVDQNDDPVAQGDTDTVDEEGILNVDAANGVLANDTDEDDDSLSVTEVTDGTATVVAGTAIDAVDGGIFTINADGSYTFNPNGDFNDLAVDEDRETSVTYTVSDGQGGSDTATLTVTVTGENDAPVAVDDAPVDLSDINDPLVMNEDGTLSIAASTLLGNDTDPDTSDNPNLSISAVTDATIDFGNGPVVVATDCSGG